MIIFSYDSLLPKFLGTTISCYHYLSDLYVIAQKTNSNQIIGTFTQTHKFLKKNSHPFDVTIHSYDPINDIPYQAKIIGIHITSIEEISPTYQKCHFSAHHIVNWTK